MIRLQKEGLLVQTFRNLILSGEFKEARGWHSEALRILDWNIFFQIRHPTNGWKIPVTKEVQMELSTAGSRGRGRGLVFSYFGYGFWMILWSFFLEQSFWRCCRYFHGCCRFSTICIVSSCPLDHINLDLAVSHVSVPNALALFGQSQAGEGQLIIFLSCHWQQPSWMSSQAASL